MSEETAEVKANRKKAKAKLTKIIKGKGSVGIGTKGLEARLKNYDDDFLKTIPKKLHGIKIEIVLAK